MITNRYLTTSAFAIIFLCALSSCSKTSSILNRTFSFSTPAQTFAIPPVPNAVAYGSGIMPTVSGSFKYDLDSAIKAASNNALSINNLGSLKLASCVITETNNTTVADSSNFSSFQSITISFTSVSNSTPYQLTVNQPDVFATSMTLAPLDTNAEMKSYLQGSNFNYAVDGKMRRGTKDTMKCNAVFTFTVKVQG